MLAPFGSQPERRRTGLSQRTAPLRAAEREIIEIPSGSTPLKYTNKSHFTIRGVVSGGGGNGNGEPEPPPTGERAVRDGGGSDQDGIRVDGCTDVIIENLEIKGFYRGLRTGNSNQIACENLSIHDCEQQGILTVSTLNFSGKRLTVNQIRVQHGVYFSETVDGVLLEDCALGGSTGDVALQINSEGGAHPARNCRVVNTTIDDDKAVNLLGGDLRLEACQVNGRINVDAAYGHADWHSHLTFASGSTHEGPLNINDEQSTVTWE